MSRKLTTAEWIAKAQSVHGNKYDYSRSQYVSSGSKIEIVCPEHGSFWQNTRNHLQKRGCPKCCNAKKYKYTPSGLLQAVREVHGEKYHYPSFEHLEFEADNEKPVGQDWKKKIEIVCPVHGSFWQSVGNHLYNKTGCPRCRNLDNITDFVEKAVQTHGSLYDYSLVQYLSTYDKVEIVCPEHGSFWQTPNSHLSGSGCPSCQCVSFDSFLAMAEEKHGGRYDYSLVNFHKMKTEVEIVCPEHGSFWQTPSSHLKTRVGCKECYWESVRHTNESFVEIARTIHGDRYDYSRVEYRGIQKNVEIVCPVHGSFWQTPDNHKRHGCPSCSYVGASGGERDILNFLSDELELEVKSGDRSLIAPKELDIVVPAHKVAIEFNGLYWHSTATGTERRYHLDKTLACKEQDYRLIHLYEDEWRDNRERVKNFLISIFRPDLLVKYDARKTKAVVLDRDDKRIRPFLEKHHAQGFVGSSIKLALEDQHENIIAYMSFRKTDLAGDYELNRYCTAGNVRGGFSKLLKFFSRVVGSYRKIVSYADYRTSSGGLYDKNGFTFVGLSQPSFDYVRGTNRYNRQKYMKKYLPDLLPEFDPNLTERENMSRVGFYQLWNCGFLKYEKLGQG